MLAEDAPNYRNPKLPTNQRVADLLSRLTVEEKVGQLSFALGWPMYEKHGDAVGPSAAFKDLVKTGRTCGLWGLQRADPWTKVTLKTGLSPKQAAEAVNAIQKYAIENSRLGIPLLLAEECPHGHMAIGATVFPTAIGQASTWDPALIEKMAAAIAAETRAAGCTIGYGPVLDLAREPRWSRVEETYGEDPVLARGDGCGDGARLSGGRPHRQPRDPLDAQTFRRPRRARRGPQRRRRQRRPARVAILFASALPRRDSRRGRLGHELPTTKSTASPAVPTRPC